MSGITFNYLFSSGLGYYEHARFVTNTVMEINLTNEYGDKVETIGKVEFLIININEASQSNYPLYDVLDAHSEYLARHVFKFFDPYTADYTEKLNKHYSYDLTNRNFCLIEKITLLPKYRGYSIAAKAIRDVVFHYGAGCGLFVIQPYPLQFELFDDGSYDSLNLQSFGKTESASKRKLSAYYKRVGFEAVKGIKDLLFYNPALQNPRMDEIDLEEPDVFKLKIVK